MRNQDTLLNIVSREGGSYLGMEYRPKDTKGNARYILKFDIGNYYFEVLVTELKSYTKYEIVKECIGSPYSENFAEKGDYTTARTQKHLAEELFRIAGKLI